MYSSSSIIVCSVAHQRALLCRYVTSLLGVLARDKVLQCNQAQGSCLQTYTGPYVFVTILFTNSKLVPVHRP